MYQQRQDQKLYTQSKLHCGRTPCLLDGLQMLNVMHFASGTLAILSNSNLHILSHRLYSNAVGL